MDIEKIKKLSKYKKEAEDALALEIARQASLIQDEFESYIHNKNIPLVERFSLWLQAPNEMKNNKDYDNSKNEHLPAFYRYMKRLASAGLEFDMSVDLTYIMTDFIKNGEIYDFLDSIEQTHMAMEFVLEENLGQTIQQEED